MILKIPQTEKCDWYEEEAGTFADVINAVKNPLLTPHKHAAPLWAFYKPITFPQYGYWNKPKFITDNFEYCFALLLDFDNDDSGTQHISVDEAITKFESFEFALYTSYRHKPEHHKFRMVVPLKTPIDHTWFRCRKVKQWFVDKFPGVDILASIKTLQKHYVPAHNPDDTNYRYHINNTQRLELPLELFSQFVQEQVKEDADNWKPAKLPPNSIFDWDIADLDEYNFHNFIISKHESELANMSWERSSGFNVHGELCRIAYSLQMHNISSWYEIIMSYAPESYTNEIKRMKIMI